MKYSLVVFDWDGTLADSTGRIIDSMLMAGQSCALPEIPASAVQNIIGLGLPEAIEMLWPGIDGRKALAVRDAYSHNFISGSDIPMGLFAGAEALLNDIAAKGASMAVATGKSRRGLDRILKEINIGHHFAATRCADETLSKPDPLMLKQIIHELGVCESEVLMVGDTEYDLEMANLAGVHSLGLTHGAHSEDRLRACSPQAILHNLDELNKWLLQEELCIG